MKVLAAILYLMPLAFERTMTTMESVFAKVKAMQVSSASTQAALSLAAFVVAVKLIRMSYEIMSDEQQGGFGGLRLWSVLRPLLLVVAIHYSGLLFGYMDGVVSFVAGAAGPENALHSTMSRELERTRLEMNAATGLDNEALAAYVDLRKVRDGNMEAIRANAGANAGMVNSTWQGRGTAQAAQALARERQARLVEEAREGRIAADPDYRRAVQSIQQDVEAASSTGVVPASLMGFSYALDWDGGTAAQAGLAASRGDSGLLMELATAAISEVRKPFEAKYTLEYMEGVLDAYAESGVENFSGYGPFDVAFDRKAFRKAVNNGSWFFNVAWWLYDAVTFIVGGFASIVLCVLAMFFPWVLCFALMDQYKNGVWAFFTSYLTVSLYKVILVVIDGAVSMSVVALRRVGLDAAISQVAETAEQQESAIGSFSSITALILVAGFVAMTKVGSIASMIIPGGGAAGDIGGAGAGIATAALGKGAAAAKGTAQGVGKVAGAAVAHRGSGGNSMGKASGGGAGA